MKILHVNEYLAGGGAEHYIAQICKELSQKGHQNLLLYGRESYENIYRDTARKIYIENITSVRCQHINSKLNKVNEFIDYENPDLIYIHQAYNSPLCEFLTTKRPSIRYVHDLKLICPEGRKTLKSKSRICTYPLEYACQRHAFLYKCMPRNPFIGLPLIYHIKNILHAHQQRSHMVVASGFMKSALIRNGVSENKISVIPYFTKLPKPLNAAHSRTEPIILCLGRVVEDKGMHYLLQTFSTIKGDARLIVVGDGPALTDLKNLAENLNLGSRVLFKGWLSHDQLDEYYRQCDLVAVPSVWPEPFGIVGIEAMAYQKPVVAFDVGGINEWCKNGKTGFLVNAYDLSSFAERINLLLERPDLAKEMGREGRKLVENRFSSETHLDFLLALMKHTIQSVPH